MANRSEIVREGYLNKSPPQEKSLAHWHKRFFVLWSSKLMEYYSSSEKRPQDYLKSIDLGCCEDLVAPMQISRRNNVIKLTINDKGKVRDYLFQCETARDMDDWVKSLVSVLDFTAVDDTEATPDSTDQKTLAVDSPGTRPRLQTPASSGRSSRPQSGVKLPRPPPKPPQSQPVAEEDGPEAEYIVPGEVFEDGYHTLSPSEDQDLPQDYYEEIDTTEGRGTPGPVWRPTAPAPPPTRAKRWIRSLERPKEGGVGRGGGGGRGRERGGGAIKPKPPPMKPPIKSTRPTHSRTLPTSPKSVSSDGEEASREPCPYEEQYHQPELDHTAEAGKTPAGKFGPLSPEELRGFGVNVRNDPKFKQKLEEKRQELYGVGGVSAGGTCEEDVPQDQYEEIAFTTAVENIPGMAVPGPGPQRLNPQLKRPPINTSGGGHPAEGVTLADSDAGYVDLEPHDESQPEYETANVRLSSTSVDWDTSAPPLPPRDEVSLRPPAPPSSVPHQTSNDLRPPALPPSDSTRLSSDKNKYRSSLPPVTPPLSVHSDIQRRGSTPLLSPSPPPLPSRDVPARADPQRRGSTPVLSPPPLPSRELKGISMRESNPSPPPPLPSRELKYQPTVEEESLPPPPLRANRPVSPVPRKDRRPMPPPPRDKTTPSRLVPASLPPPSEGTDSPPPVPRRHPQHSDKQRSSRTSLNSLFPVGADPDEHSLRQRSLSPPRQPRPSPDGPPVPQRSRGAPHPQSKPTRAPSITHQSRQASVSDPPNIIVPSPPQHSRQTSVPSNPAGELEREDVSRSKSSPPPPPSKPRPPATRPKPKILINQSSSPLTHPPRPPTKPKPAVLPKPKPAKQARPGPVGGVHSVSCTQRT